MAEIKNSGMIDSKIRQDAKSVCINKKKTEEFDACH
jgi:hypothetical protein